jgi:cytochrome c-type biogenesis protein
MDDLALQWLNALSGAIAQSPWLAPMLALFAGVLTSFSPCCLSSVPLVIACVGGIGAQNTRRAFWLSAVFSAGMAVTFAILGTAAALMGRLFIGASWWYLVLGVLMVLMALQTWEIFSFIPSTHALGRTTRRGMAGAFLAGVLGGFFSSPCSTPVLVVLLAMVAQRGSLLWGMFLLLLYSVGHSTLVMLAGTSVGFVRRLSASPKYGRVSHLLRLATGALILLMALYMFYLGF